MEQNNKRPDIGFVWRITDDVLRDTFKKNEIGEVILPFLVVRRIDCILAPVNGKVRAAYENFKDKVADDKLDPILRKATGGMKFYNTSRHTLLSLTDDAKNIAINFDNYLNGFSPEVKEILRNFQFDKVVARLVRNGLLYQMIQAVSGLDFSPEKYDNHDMGYVFEELIRISNEQSNETAGEHFTPRDYVRLLGQLAVEPIKDKITDNTYTIYDGACGTGGILTIAQEEIERIATEEGKRVRTSIFGQELQPDTYATCKADLMISGNINKFSYRLGTVDHQYIAFGSTISQDGHAGEKFDFCISNPPFGTPWKEDLKNWGIGDKKEITDPRFFDGVNSFIPDIGDCQMLFLANNISRMKDTPLGTRIVEVHNGSSLFTGNAGGGESNLRRYIIENDLLEAIVAMPEKDFYNTGIGTYIWIITNSKEERRKGFVQLIDATNICTPLRKNLGEKNCETSEADRQRIVKLLTDFKETPESKIFKNEEFGYWQVPVLRPKRDKEGNIVLKKGKPVMACNKKECEQIPLLYPGGIAAFYEQEVKPYDAEAEFGEPIIGYELSFTKYFYKPVQLRTLDAIMEDIRSIERDTDGLLDEIMK